MANGRRPAAHHASVFIGPALRFLRVRVGLDSLVGGLQEPKPQMIGARADFPLAARANHIVRAVLVRAEKQPSAMDALLLAGL